jgi:hypothetical protein
MHHLPLTIMVGFAMFGYLVSRGEWVFSSIIVGIILIRVIAVVKELSARRDFPPYR